MQRTGPDTTGQDPGVWSNSPLPFFVSFIMTIFVPDCAVAAQIGPQNTYRDPNGNF